MKFLTPMLLAAAVTVSAAIPSAAFAVEDQKETFSITINDKLGKGDVYGEIITTVKYDQEEYLITKKLKIARRDSKGKEIWKVQDYVNECPLDATLQMVRPLSLTDYDDNGLREIWMVYKLACRGDVSPADMKIIMYEGKTKHAVRGTMKLPMELQGEMTQSYGSHTADENMKKAYPVFREHAEYIWKNREIDAFDDN